MLEIIDLSQALDKETYRCGGPLPDVDAHAGLSPVLREAAGRDRV